MSVGIAINIRARHQGELLLVSVRGVLAPAGLHELRREVASMLVTRDVRAAVVDVRSVVPLFGPGDHLEALDEGVRTDTVPRVPIAIVVSDAMLSAVQAFSESSALRHGLVRVVFSDFQEAVAWAMTVRYHWRHYPPLTIASCPVLAAGGCEQQQQPPQCRSCVVRPP